MRQLTRTALLAAACLAVPSTLPAHGPIHEQITALTARIAREPLNAELYLRRGELHRAHRAWRAALADYGRAARLEPGLGTVDLCRGVLWLEAGQPRKALPPLDRFLARHPDHARAHATRARVLVRLGQRLPGAEEFSRAITLSAAPPPEYYLERASALAEEGRLPEALRGIDSGLERIGPAVTLQLLALDLELKQGLYEAALARLDRAWMGSARRETWLVRRGEILERAGRTGEAREAYALGLAALQSLPSARRNTRAVQELGRQAQAGVDRCGGPPDPSAEGGHR